MVIKLKEDKLGEKMPWVWSDEESIFKLYNILRVILRWDEAKGPDDKNKAEGVRVER